MSAKVSEAQLRDLDDRARRVWGALRSDSWSNVAGVIRRLADEGHGMPFHSVEKVLHVLAERGYADERTAGSSYEFRRAVVQEPRPKRPNEPDIRLVAAADCPAGEAPATDPLDEVETALIAALERAAGAVTALRALRSQVAAQLPDPEELRVLREKAAMFDQLQSLLGHKGAPSSTNAKETDR